MDGTATEQLSMTAAELSFLLASGDRPGEAPRLLGLTADDHADGALLFDAGSIRFLVGARTYRCCDITPVPADTDVREPLLAVADRFLHRHRPAVATFNASTAADLARGLPPSRATLASSADGSWQVTGVDGTGSAAEDFDGATAVIREELAKILPLAPASG